KIFAFHTIADHIDITIFRQAFQFTFHRTVDRKIQIINHTWNFFSVEQHGEFIFLGDSSKSSWFSFKGFILDLLHLRSISAQAHYPLLEQDVWSKFINLSANNLIDSIMGYHIVLNL